MRIPGRRSASDLREELEFHIRQAIDDGIGRGLSRQEAEREARLRYGSVAAGLDWTRDARPAAWLDGTLADLRQAAAAMCRHRRLSAIVGSALAASVAVNTLIFSLVHGVLLRPLPYPEPDRLVRVYGSSERSGKFPLSIGAFQDIQRDNQVFANLALYTGEDLQLMHDAQPERLAAVQVTPGFLATLGATPAMGRDFTDSDCVGPPHVVILSHTLWRTRFHSDPAIVGKSVRLNRGAWTVIGVLKPGFQHIGGAYRSPLQGETVALWYPLRMNLSENATRGWHFTNTVARLKPGVTLQQAQHDMDRMVAGIRQRHPKWEQQLKGTVSSLAAEVAGGSPATLRILMVAGLLVMLIAAVNAAALGLARALERRKEIAVRCALGAGTWRLARTVLCENIVLGLAGGLAGLALAAALSPLWHRLLPVDFPRVHEVRLTPVSAAFALGLALAGSLLAALAPMLRQWRSDPADPLKQDTRGASASRQTAQWRGLLVAGEVALAVLLCASAVLLVRSSRRLMARPHGFQPENVLTFQLSLPPAGYPDAARTKRLFADSLERWRALPGVLHAGAATDIPWSGYDENSNFDIAGAPEGGPRSPQARFHTASPGYFEALRTPLRAGRLFTDADAEGAAPVVVVNESLVREYLSGREPLSTSLNLWGENRRIVGVVADIRDQPADRAAEPAFWFPLGQMPNRNLTAVLHTAGEAASFAAGAASALHELDRELPVHRVLLLDDVAGAALAERRLATWLVQAFAALALGLSGVGLYGLLLYQVQQREFELGIRLALGALPASIAWLVSRQAALLAAGGALAGLALLPVAGGVLRSLLYGVSALDPWTLALTLLLTASLAALCVLLPALSAARLTPARVLRND